MMQKITKLPAIHRPGRLPGNLRYDKDGEKPKRLSPRQIEEAAQYFIRTDCSNLRNQVLSLLYEFKALSEITLFRLTAAEIAISEKPASFRARMNAYIRAGLVEPVSRGVIKQVLRAGVPHPENGSLRAYRLGPVGVEIARIKFVKENHVPLTTIENEDRLAHDLICAEAMWKLERLWAAPITEGEQRLPGYVEIHGPGAISLWDAENQKALLEPDGLIFKYGLDDIFQRAYLVEYHNNNAKMHVENKIAKYERLASPAYDGLWQSWGLNAMPLILVLYRQAATLSHYQEELRKIARKGIRATYSSTALASVWSGPLQVYRIDYEREKPSA